MLVYCIPLLTVCSFLVIGLVIFTTVLVFLLQSTQSHTAENVKFPSGATPKINK